MGASICYTGCRLDRGAEFRRAPGWFEARIGDSRTAIVPIWQDSHFVTADEPPRPALITGERGRAVAERADHLALLGLDASGAAIVVADVSAATEDDVARMVGDPPIPLRRVGARLAGADGALLAYARGLVLWHRRHRFCGVCGHRTVSREAGHVLACSDPSCAAEHFPRTDPAVIMLITRSAPNDERCLLARQSRWPRGMYSTLAGFVEPGESLEEAVVRETFEEVGLTVTAVRYRGSQPWPFPSSLMLGFRGEALGEEPIRFDGNELENARWFTRTEVADFHAQGLRLPSPDSIARRLLCEWLDEPSRAG